MMGIRLERLDERPVDGMLAMVHTVLFWAANVILTPLILLADAVSRPQAHPARPASGHCRHAHRPLNGHHRTNVKPAGLAKPGKLAFSLMIEASRHWTEFRGGICRSTVHDASAKTTPQFFLTAPSPCPYLSGQFERKVFTHLVGDKAPELNDLLTQGGFRRSQNIAYRPACETCRACVSVRILAQEFKPTRNMKRVWQRNADLIGVGAPGRALDRAIFAVSALSRRPPQAGRHVRHDGARLRHDGGGHPCRHQGHRIPRRGPASFITGKGEGDLIAWP
jgi:hypothetical protein